MAFAKAVGPTVLTMIAAVAAGAVWWSAAASSPQVRLAPDDTALFALTRHGLEAMLGPDSTYGSNIPAYEGMPSDEAIVAALSYIKSRRPRHVRERHDAIDERASK